MPGIDAILTTAFDHVDYGIVLLDKNFDAQYINRAFHQIWSLPKLAPGAKYTFSQIVEHGRRTGAYRTAPTSVADYVRQRKGRIRLTDGRVLMFECKNIPDDGRLLTFSDITHLVHAADEMRERAAVDDLTKLYTRRQFLVAFENEFSRALTYNRSLSVLMIDADEFKQVNDRYGHFAGDEVLRGLGVRLRSVARQSDLIGRLGGEEFAAALPETDQVAAVTMAERACREMSNEPFIVDGSAIRATVSVGVASRRPNDDNAAELLRRADHALYEAKSGGRNRVIATDQQ
jgi:diguanylate cyclase (GGDEF)-like protein